MNIKRHLKSALEQLGFDKPRKAQIIPMNTLDAEQDAIIIAATGSGKHGNGVQPEARLSKYLPHR